MEFNIAVRSKFGGKKKTKKEVSKLLLKILCWGEKQELSLFIVLLFGKILRREKFMSTDSRKTLRY